VGYLKKFWVLKPQTPVFFDFLEMSDKKVVICGGGIIGCSIAYFLTKLGQVKRHF
jgi:pyruvate/2-oxoglutarate dehydrogenase complex dihydrolipoamide dehydrogenase (E3) component